jgi:hypothetical protein
MFPIYSNKTASRLSCYKEQEMFIFHNSYVPIPGNDNYMKALIHEKAHNKYVIGAINDVTQHRWKKLSQ